jgi:hypothetical protein
MKIILLILFALPLSLSAQNSDDEALTFLKNNCPEIHAKITSLKGDDYATAIADARVAAVDFVRLKEAGDNAVANAYLKMYEIDFEAIGVADEIAASKDEKETERLKEKLSKLIAASFDKWAVVEQARVARLEKELGKLKLELQTAVREREKVIAADTAQLIEEARKYGQKIK